MMGKPYSIEISDEAEYDRYLHQTLEIRSPRDFMTYEDNK